MMRSLASRPGIDAIAFLRLCGMDQTQAAEYPRWHSASSDGERVRNRKRAQQRIRFSLLRCCWFRVDPNPRPAHRIHRSALKGKLPAVRIACRRRESDRNCSGEVAAFRTTGTTRASACKPWFVSSNDCRCLFDAKASAWVSTESLIWRVDTLRRDRRLDRRVLRIWLGWRDSIAAVSGHHSGQHQHSHQFQSRPRLFDGRHGLL